MHTNEAPRIQRHCDVAIVGGSATGLAAALQLGRQRRSVIVVDSSEPRNAPATHMHSYLGHEGLPPSAFAALSREEVRSFGTEVLSDRVELVTRTDDGRFVLELAGGHSILARRVLAATGVRDELPDIDGLAEHWGTDVISCPFCHGYEVRDQRIVQLLTHSAGLHPATLFRHLSSAFTVVVHGGADIEPSALDLLRRGGVNVVEGTVSRVVAGDDGRVTGIELSDQRRIDADAIVVSTRFTARIEPFADLGLRAQEHPSGLGEFVEADATGATSVPGLYAAGNLTDPSRQVLPSAADGSRVGAMIAMSLADEDLETAARTSANQSDWDHRYGGEQIWSGNPNGTLVREISSLTPGRVLDVGAGEGGDAIWLAEQKWNVTAADISQRALDRLHAAATAHGLDVACRQADANAQDAFEPAAFDLVTAHYASIPRTRDRRGIKNLIGAVAPGGTLLFVGHDLEPLRDAGNDHGHSRPFDPDAYLRVEDVAAALGDSPEWQIETWEKRPRPAGAASAGHHVHDEVLRARRR
ncbi:bifunctional NAD(P)/FAD-dependent oxidoreductase/class I SAM-dependent methyltransferase [Actinospica robiniae]|uniref:bifunctional NAD(P)/FAD-dependent oxidoreductase/class I SAM-dependent methyltransferase n=1 Tax=Actinospica robiniae TaxID=304901 RepID=UPI0005566E0D|nr:bifunctional NAD(P)/FAD-dependent oxidoreductase/class I SAM-dependent methyltransferase [Actinospica robiniae]